MIPDYPDSVEISIDHREVLHPMFQKLEQGISEFTFANIYLFRQQHNYRLTRVDQKHLVILGDDNGASFFMCPFGLPSQAAVNNLFDTHVTLKCATRLQANHFEERGFIVTRDRDNFDYLYSRKSLAELSGRKYHKKRNLIKAFVNNYAYEGRPLLDEHIPQAVSVLDEWQKNRRDHGDYLAAREALEKCDPLQLCGGIYYVDNRPVAYTLGEELARGTSFVIHFEKALNQYKGIYQFVNQAFAAIITDHYETINREQDLGNPGLRQAKMSYKPSGFVEKFKITRPGNMVAISPEYENMGE
ncbi:hypothetical protein SAMN02746065_11344 [Desulfocicer vacuolatum DSM 3385]|uniref:Phosphatidylglycerol lysyltransferase C-terminal domain-containing protein n=1 Tax=Desulfocicer vacuolatum DSM 3385 TaxID=1121400 RepID=A0A1W2CQ53_9BACT|nr:DUF2156 domain-containing protein [Desulfocicer vacuolatum]SMC87331.1 hypothetical protein SAMN02746065_11344 [Desulfocicer vacuolatum DSM 3385]